MDSRDAVVSAIATADDFISSLRPHADKPLVFEYGGRRIQAGYHVTEIKAASFQSVDCGANPEQWNETVVQLWDVPGREGETFMTARKFLAIWDKVAARVPLDRGATLVFECGDDASPALRYTAEGLRADGDALVVSLAPVRASCKPRDRWYDALGVTPPALAPAASPVGLVGVERQATGGCRGEAPARPVAGVNAPAQASAGCC